MMREHLFARATTRIAAVVSSGAMDQVPGSWVVVARARKCSRVIDRQRRLSHYSKSRPQGETRPNSLINARSENGRSLHNVETPVTGWKPVPRSQFSDGGIGFGLVICCFLWHGLSARDGGWGIRPAP